MKKVLNIIRFIIKIVKKNKLLQIGLLTCLIAIFGFGSAWIPNSYKQYNFLVLKIGIYLFIVLVTIALIILGLGIFSSKSNKKVLSISEKGYNKTSKLAFHLLVAFVIITIGVNFSIYLTPLIKDFVVNNLSFIIFFLIIGTIFYYLDKKGIKLFKDE